MAGAIKGCTGREPTLVGKPSPLMIDYMVEKFGIERGRICMATAAAVPCCAAPRRFAPTPYPAVSTQVGDRLDTDILFGQNNGLLSCLTLSGVTTEEKLLSPENEIKPDFYVDSIADFL